MIVQDITIGTRVVFDGMSTVWTVVGKRKIERKAGAKYVFRLVFEKDGIEGKATTKPLDAEFEIETRP